MHRMTGYNFEKIGMMCEKVHELHNDGMGYFGDSAKTWERFYDEYDKFSRYGEYDRDAFRANYESNADQHRGPGTGSFFKKG
mgnify:CR=1 FL=1